MAKSEQLTGRALDAAVAEQVMALGPIIPDWPCGINEEGCYVAAADEHEAKELPHIFSECGPAYVPPALHGTPGAEPEPVPFYSRDIADAWLVHQRMLDTQPGEYAFAFQRLSGLWELWGRTLHVLRAITPELICHAALAAVGGRGDE